VLDFQGFRVVAGQGGVYESVGVYPVVPVLLPSPILFVVKVFHHRSKFLMFAPFSVFLLATNPARSPTKGREEVMNPNRNVIILIPQSLFNILTPPS